MAYNLTQVQGNNLYTFMSGANTLSGGLLASLFLVVLFVVVFVSSKRFETKVAFATSSFITALIGLLFRVMNWIGDDIMFMTFVLVAISYAFLQWGD